MKKAIKDYLSISTSDKRAFVALVFLLFVIFLLPAIYNQFAAPVAFDFTPYATSLSALEAKQEKEQHYLPKWTETEQDQIERIAAAELFKFDPNELDYDLGIRLGLPRKVASNIEKYLAKNGQFRQKSDLRRIYGMTEADYARVESYITLPAAPKYKKDKGQYAYKNTKKRLKTSKPKSEPIVLQAFNPNELTKAEAVAMGMSSKVAQTFINFRDKIGGFKTKAQIQRVYGLEDLYPQLEPFIELPEQATPTSTQQPTSTFAQKETKEHKKYNKTYTKNKSDYANFRIDLNATDTAEWKKLRGIGEVFAQRIVKFQKLLGGFTNKQQLLEVYGMDEERYSQIEGHLVNEQQTSLQQIRLNEATLDQLKKHPYIDYQLAKGIVTVKEKYGFYTNTKGLLDFDLVDETNYQKLKPYLTIKRTKPDVADMD